MLNIFSNSINFWQSNNWNTIFLIFTNYGSSKINHIDWVFIKNNNISSKKLIIIVIKLFKIFLFIFYKNINKKVYIIKYY